MGEAERSSIEIERFKAELNANFRVPLVAYFLRRVRDRSEAEDLTQEVFLRVLNQSETVDPVRAKAYVFAAAGNLLRDRGRRIAARRTSSYGTLDDPEKHQNPDLVEEIDAERVLVGRETLREVLIALNGLNQRTRDIFVLYRIERMKQHEIASLLGLSIGAVEKNLVKAMTYLAERFDRP